VSETPNASAILDCIRFASNQNPITEIPLRLGRGSSLTNKDLNEEEGENTNLPLIIGGPNASGKTSLLHGVKKICNILQKAKILKKHSEEIWEELNSMGIRHLELQFVVVIGLSTPPLGVDSFSYGLSLGMLEKPFLLDVKQYDLMWSQSGMILESMVQINFSKDEDAKALLWRDGLRLRVEGRQESLTKFYPTYAVLSEDKKTGAFRKIKSTESIKRFLEDNQGNDISGYSLSSFRISESKLNPFSSLNFQNAEMITVDREESAKEIERIKSLLPEVSKKFKQWRDNPEELRSLLIEKLTENQLFTEMGLRTSDILHTDNTLHDYAPGIVEFLMINTSPNQMYTWYGDYVFETKQDGINFIMEGCVHDIVEFVTSEPNLSRVITGTQTGHSSRKGPVYRVKWEDKETSDRSEIIWQKRIVNSKPARPLSESLRELPFLSTMLGMKKKDQKVVDILVRFNAFTPIERIEDPYLSSGQKQVLALISAVRNAPPGSLILIDEPEISLHVDWQERLVEQLHSPLIDSRLLIATHSPDIVINHRHLCTTLLVNEGGEFYRS
tara:strand:- start:859 stop:2529 length:1671 start_codon:yes stop_codon:yes gene_type:complete